LYWIYDIETYKNIFTLTAIYENGNGLRTFEISDRKNDVDEMLDFLRKIKSHNHKMVGFNNIGFDFQIIQHILLKSKTAKIKQTPLVIEAEELFDNAQEVIKNESFNNIKESDFIIPQVDLYKIHHFDNKAKATSLKMIEFNMKSDNIEDLPYNINKILNDTEKDKLILYNIHDVNETLKFFNESKEAISFRERLTQKYGFDCTNYNDTKIGKEYFISRLENMGVKCFTKGHKGGKTPIQSPRSIIDVNDIVFPYITFDRPEFKAVLDWFKQQRIRETKGVFNDLLESDIGSCAKYAKLTKKNKKLQDEPTTDELSLLKETYPMGWLEKRPLKAKNKFSYYWCWNIVDTMNIVVDGFRFDFGVGGIHGSLEGVIETSDEEWVVKDADVSSMYPNLSIVNRVYPEHLTEKFCDIYQSVYEERKKHPKGSAENAVMKLALNGTYGESNNEYSCFYDPKFTMAITINGQLSLCMLAEKLLTIPECVLIQCNTDGVTVRIKKEYVDLYNTLCKEWEKETKLALEFVDYDKMIVRDCNNYIASMGDKTKRKGAYEYENLGWHQNQSALVVPMAAEHELLGKGCAEDFIRNHQNKYDFLLRTKVNRSSRLVLKLNTGEEIPQQNICRYYVSTEGGNLIKIMPPLEGKEEERLIGIEVGHTVKTCNNIKHFKWDVNYDYYISEARKLIDPFKSEGEAT
jgi:hypothetical protein